MAMLLEPPLDVALQHGEMRKRDTHTSLSRPASQHTTHTHVQAMTTPKTNQISMQAVPSLLGFLPYTGLYLQYSASHPYVPGLLSDRKHLHTEPEMKSQKEAGNVCSLPFANPAENPHYLYLHTCQNKPCWETQCQGLFLRYARTTTYPSPKQTVLRKSETDR